MWIYGVVAAVCLAMGFAGGWRVESWRNDAAQLEAQNKATAKFKREEKTVDVAAVGHEDFKAKEDKQGEQRTRTIRVLVDRPVYRNICIDDDGVRLLNAAIEGRDDSGEPAPALPGSAAPAGR